MTLISQAFWDNNRQDLHLEDIGFKGGNSAASSILGITLGVKFICDQRRPHSMESHGVGKVSRSWPE